MECLIHYGVKGQKWGVRRYQNKDGSLTLAGKKRHLRRLRSEDVDGAMQKFSKMSLKMSYNRMLGKQLGDQIVRDYANKGRLLALPLQAYSYTQLSQNYSSFIDELFDN